MEIKDIDKLVDQYVNVKYRLCEDDEEGIEAKGILHKGWTAPIFKLGKGKDYEPENGYWVEGIRIKISRFLGTNVIKLKKMSAKEIEEFEEAQCKWKGIKRRKKK